MSSKVYISRVPLNDEGFDKNGVWHGGLRTNLWVMDPNYGYSRFFRAPHVTRAKKTAQRSYPDAEIILRS